MEETGKAVSFRLFFHLTLKTRLTISHFSIFGITSFEKYSEVEFYSARLKKRLCATNFQTQEILHNSLLQFPIGFALDHFQIFYGMIVQYGTAVWYYSTRDSQYEYLMKFRRLNLEMPV